MIEHKRRLCSVDQSSVTSVASKRHKEEMVISTKVSSPSLLTSMASTLK